MTEPRTCVFCGGTELTLEHVYPRWLVPLIPNVPREGGITRVTEHEEHVHHYWDTPTIDLKARKVCGTCNGGWMSELEQAAAPILTPLVRSPKPQTITPLHAVTLSTWVTKTALATSLLHADKARFILDRYFAELYRRRRPLRDSVVWIATYDGSRYPMSDSGVPIPPVNGFRVTGNIGYFAYQLTAADGVGNRETLVLPPDEFAPYLTETWPAPEGPVRRQALTMNDEQLRYLSQVPDHSWGVKGAERPPVREKEVRNRHPDE